MNPEVLSNPADAYSEGNQVFARMFTRWMDGNNWSHPVMTKLSRWTMGGKQGWLHSSQISSLRTAGTRNPGPRTFVAIERLNYYIWRYQTTQALLPNSTSSNDYATAIAITEDGVAPSFGWFMEVFAGYRVPTEFKFQDLTIPASKASLISKRLGRLIRQQIVQNDKDLIEDLGSLLFAHYPTKEQTSISRIKSLILSSTELQASDLETELSNVSSFLNALGYQTSPETLLSELRR